jgi:hypothetical protein
MNEAPQIHEAINRACAAVIAGDTDHIHAAEEDVADLIEGWTKALFNQVFPIDDGFALGNGSIDLNERQSRRQVAAEHLKFRKILSMRA